VTTGGRWEHFPHGADIGVRGIGASMSEAFTQTALALTAAVTDPASVRDEDRTNIGCEAPDAALLLVDWLNAIVYEMATARRLFGRFDVAIAEGPDGLVLTGAAYGEPVDRARHQPAVEVKGATHTALGVERRDDGAWIAQCVVDV
jgi:SHS2 domain-containing protein